MYNENPSEYQILRLPDAWSFIDRIDDRLAFVWHRLEYSNALMTLIQFFIGRISADNFIH